MPKHFDYKSIIRFEDYSVFKLSFLLHNDCNRGKIVNSLVKYLFHLMVMEPTYIAYSIIKLHVKG